MTRLTRLGWETIAKARLTAQVLIDHATRIVDQLADGTQVLIDEATAGVHCWPAAAG